MKSIPFNKEEFDFEIELTITMVMLCVFMALTFFIFFLIDFDSPDREFPGMISFVFTGAAISAIAIYRSGQPHRGLTEELLAYMTETQKTSFTWQELKETLALERFRCACGKKLWKHLVNDENDAALVQYLHYLMKTGWFPEINGVLFQSVSFRKEEKKKEKKKKGKHKPSLPPMENKEDHPLNEAYRQVFRIFLDAPESLAKQASQLQHDLKLLCNLVAYNGTQGVDIHKVYDYYVPSLVKTYQAYQHLRAIKAPALKETKQELLTSMQTLHEALSILCERISKANQDDLSAELSTLRNVIKADGLGAEELSAS